MTERIPWNKGKKGCFSEETINKMSLTRKGRKLPDEQKNKQKETMRRLFKEKKLVIWNKGIIGNKNYLFGKHLPKETRLKISNSHKLRIMNGKKPLIVGWNKGKHLSEKHIKNMSLVRKGKKFTEEHKKKLSLAKLNNKNPNWKGDNVGYASLHDWIRRYKPKPELCENCKKVMPIDVANISGKYKRDINDFRWICRKCHQLEDGRLYNLRQYKNGYKEKV